MLNAIVLCVAAAVCSPQSLSLGDPGPTTPVGDEVVYRFRSDRFVVSSVDLEIGAGGKGRLVFARKGLAKPVEREIVVAEPVVREIDEAIARLRFLESTEAYQTSSDHSNLGQVTIAVTRAGAHRETEFNYTTNKDMAELQSLLRGLATREMYAFDLETATRYQPLDTPKLLGTLDDEVARGSITDPAALVPQLRAIAEDVSLPLIARNRATALVAKLSKVSGK
jgi:hypothetical protein